MEEIWQCAEKKDLAARKKLIVRRKGTKEPRKEKLQKERPRSEKRIAEEKRKAALPRRTLRLKSNKPKSREILAVEGRSFTARIFFATEGTFEGEPKPPPCCGVDVRSPTVRPP